MSRYFLKDKDGFYQNVVTIYGQKAIMQCRTMEQAVIYSEEELPEVKSYIEARGIKVFAKPYTKVKGRYKTCI